MLRNTPKELDDEIEYGNSTIPFRVVFSKRRTLSIVVYPDCSVKVRAPQRASINHIKKVIHRKADWIKEKQDHFAKLPPVKTKTNYEEGELFSYLGDKLRLRILADIVNRVDAEDGELVVRIIKNDKNKIKKLIANWYQESAKALLPERLKICREIVSEIGIKYNGTPTIRKMRSMWGNCSRSGEIKLSYELMKAPIECIDYVIIHELCHLREFNHSKKFYELLCRVLPEWKERRKQLKEVTSLYGYCE